jgi:hypothetical protein
MISKVPYMISPVLQSSEDPRGSFSTFRQIYIIFNSSWFQRAVFMYQVQVCWRALILSRKSVETLRNFVGDVPVARHQTFLYQFVHARTSIAQQPFVNAEALLLLSYRHSFACCWGCSRHAFKYRRPARRCWFVGGVRRSANKRENPSPASQRLTRGDSRRKLSLLTYIHTISIRDE